MFDSIRKRISRKINAIGVRSAQTEGTDAAFADRLHSRSTPDIPPELLARLNTIRSEDELRDLIKEHPELLPIIRQIATQSQAPHGSSTDVSNPDNLPALLQELQGLNRLSDMPRRVELCQTALTLVNQSTQPELWGVLQVELGDSLSQNPLGPRAENLDLAFDHYNQALEVFTREAFPEYWAMTQNNLATTYSDRIRGEHAENIDLAIAHYNHALEVHTRDAFPEQWAASQNNLAIAYSSRIRGKRAENIELAIDHYNHALEVHTRDAFPEQWGTTKHNLAAAYSARIRGDRAENIDLAIDHYNHALEVRTRDAFPEDWAMTQNNLAAAYSDRIRGERAENIELAIDHCNHALEVHTRDAFPKDWAMIQNNLAYAYSNRIRGAQAENIDLAINHYNHALEVRTHDSFPEDWGMTQNNLANAYSDRIRGKRAENIELAIDHYNQALEVRTRDVFPEDWAMTQNNLANAYCNRIRGERAENVELAIDHYNHALEVRSRDAFLEDWAMTQNNLANAYRDRIRGKRAENIELAIDHYNHALEVRTLERFPADRRQTLRNLGDLHFTEQSWENALADYDGAIKAGNAVLAEAHTEVGRKAEVGETSRLYAQSAYCLLKLEQIDKAVIRLEEGKTRLLTEALSLADADLDMLSETQRQAMSKAREAVRLLEAEMRLPSDVPARRSDIELGELLRQKRLDLNELVDTLRSQHPDFMPTGLDLPGILGLIPEGGALVAPLVTSKGSAVIVIPHGADSVGTDHVVMLDSLYEDDMVKLLQGPVDDTGLGGWLDAYFTFCNEGTEAAMGQWLEVIEKSTSQLWTMLMEPVHQKLQDLNIAETAPVILMPQGYLGLLPLHAAWRDMDDERRAFIDDYTVTYVPSAYSLSISRGRIQDASRQKPSLLAVINPTEDLDYTIVEGMAVESLFDPDDRETLSGNVVTQEAVVKKAPGRTYLHFSCHGFYNWQDVMNSGLVLANRDILTLSEIISGLDLDTARLVTLSACETGMTDIQQSPDEFIGLPTGFLQAGATGVVSTLWAVNDAATSLLIKHFYRKHLQDGLPPDQALRSAQLWLRGATRKELGETYKSIESIARMSQHEAYRELIMKGDLGDKPYTNPYYWAAFTFTGV
jgi:CHAT domain-containing protein/tetratricopeptide (TPR) repeat protein